MSTNQVDGIRNISIANFRGIESLQLSFVSPKGETNSVVVLGGPNGCGKTSVLEACLIATGNEGSVQGSKGKSAIRFGANDYVIQVEVSCNGKIYNEGYSSAVKSYKLINAIYFSSWRTPNLIGAVGITAGKRGSRPAKTEINRLWRIKQFLVNARSHDLFTKLDGGSHFQGSRFEIAIERLNRSWSYFYPEQKFSIDPVSDDPEAGFDVFLRSKGKPQISVDQLSAGQLELFCFAGGLVIEDDEPGLIVIDEPELHLDQQWHRQLIRSLQFLLPKSQLLIATHSSEIFDSVRSFERYFLVDKDDARARQWTSSAELNSDSSEIVDGGSF